MPPWNVPTLIEKPRAGSESAWARSTNRASDQMALRPFSGSVPAWAHQLDTDLVADADNPIISVYASTHVKN